MMQNPKQERSRFFRIQKLARSRVCFKYRAPARARPKQTAVVRKEEEEEEETVVVIIK
jgi:hypothetical protein